MAEVKKTTTTTNTKVKREMGFLFDKSNYMWMAIGAAIIALGFILMTGGKNADPNTFDPTVTYSTMRITIAPIVILLGFVIEIYAIFKRPATRA